MITDTVLCITFSSRKSTIRVTLRTVGVVLLVFPNTSGDSGQPALTQNHWLLHLTVPESCRVFAQIYWRRRAVAWLHFIMSNRCCDVIQPIRKERVWKLPRAVARERNNLPVLLTCFYLEFLHFLSPHWNVTRHKMSRTMRRGALVLLAFSSNGNNFFNQNLNVREQKLMS